MNRLCPQTGLSIALAFLLFFVACQRTPPVTPPPPNSGNDSTSTGRTLPPTDTTQVYVLGWTNDSNVYWKNGVPVLLSTAPGVYTSGMCMVDSDVYISGGTYLTDSTFTPSYWHKNTWIPLQDTTNRALTYGIGVSGGNVYVAGTAQFNDKVGPLWGANLSPFSYAKYGTIAVCWTNGTATLLPGNDFAFDVNGFGETGISDYVNGIAVSGNDVYVTGASHQWQEGVPSTYHFAGYWKNGIFVDLPNNTDGVSTDSLVNKPLPTVTSVLVNGSDVYVTGYQYSNNSPQAVYWKNGVLTTLSYASNATYAYAICVSGNDVYVAGKYGISINVPQTLYWKNGAPVALEDNGNDATPTGIAVSGNDVYVVGQELDDGTVNHALIWKNGVLTRFSNASGAQAIIVK